MISKIVTTWWFSFLRLLIASTISSWMCLAHLSSYFLSSASSLKKKIMFVLDKSSSDSSEFITLLFGDLVCYYTLPCSLCSAASSASAARWSINIGPWFLSCQGGQGSWLSCGPHFTYPLHLYLNFLSLSSIAQRVSSLSWHFLTMARLLLADFSIQFFDLFPYDVHIGFFHDQFFYLAQIA